MKAQNNVRVFRPTRPDLVFLFALKGFARAILMGKRTDMHLPAREEVKRIDAEIHKLKARP